MPEDILLRISNMAAGQSITSGDVVRSFVDEWLALENRPLIHNTNSTQTVRSFYLTRAQDKALTELVIQSGSTVSKGMAFRAALINGIGVSDITANIP